MLKLTVLVVEHKLYRVQAMLDYNLDIGVLHKCVIIKTRRRITSTQFSSISNNKIHLNRASCHDFSKRKTYDRSRSFIVVF